MNGYQKLHQQIDRLERERNALLAGLDEIRAYLTSPKFSVDNHCNVNDVLLRIAETKSAAALLLEE